ncbi:PREDICTED: uncharacterized protein LOC109191989 [Ipomoea nil]|uniref:uncharacterized protein LOC109191989 n=1 Tax=Ipomoea nil TaxID=35883 RepID=UPI0009011911|nr:PREDICTED: uncharacterized protein LOC109191989 [Ipomoea nil]
MNSSTGSYLIWILPYLTGAFGSKSVDQSVCRKKSSEKSPHMLFCFKLHTNAKRRVSLCAKNLNKSWKSQLKGSKLNMNLTKKLFGMRQHVVSKKEVMCVALDQISNTTFPRR